MRGFIALLAVVASTSVMAQDSPYQPNVGNSQYSSGFSKPNESAMYDIRRHNWRDENQIRRDSGGGNYHGPRMRTPDAPPLVHQWTDYGKADAWKKSNRVDDQHACAAMHNDVQRMQANLDGMAYGKLNRERMDYHSYLSLVSEGSARLRTNVWQLHKHAATGTAEQCSVEYAAAQATYQDVAEKIQQHERDFTNLRQMK